MTTLRRPLRQAQRRLWLNRFFSALGWTLAGAAGIFAVAVVLDRLWLSLPEPQRWFLIVAGAGTGAAVIVSLLWTVFTRDSLHLAAARLDGAAGLKERLSSGLYCENLQDPFAQAVVADATRLSRGITVGQHLPLQVPRSAGYAGATFALALLFFWLFPAIDLAGKQQVREEQSRKVADAKRADMIVKPVIQQQIKTLAERNPLLKKEMEDLGEMKDARLDKPMDIKQEAYKKIEKLSDKLEEKRGNELAQVEEFKKILRRLGDQHKNDSPVGALSKALSKGDFKSAEQALEEIKLELSKAPTTPEEKQKSEDLKKQLDQLAKKLNDVSQENKKAQDELTKAGLKPDEVQRALEQLQKKDLNQLQQELAKKGLSQEKMNQIMQQMKKSAAASAAAGNMAQAMAKAAQGSGSGELSQSAQEGLSAAGEQLSKMESMEQELSQITSSLSDLEGMKEALNGCKSCNGTGMKNGKPCSGCNGTGMGADGNPNQRGNGMGKLGQGQGGAAPEEITDFKTAQKRSPVNTLPGRIISQQFVDGEQFKGDVSKEYIDAALAAERDVTDAISREQIPRAMQSSVSKYFTRTFGDVTRAGAGAGASASRPAGSE